MAHALLHAKADARKFGGIYQDYLPINEWFDQTKAHLPDARHRMILHNSLGIFLCEQTFGVSIINSDGKEIPVRLIAEHHIISDFGFIPTVDLCFSSMSLQPWMYQGAASLSRDPELNIQVPNAQSRVNETQATPNIAELIRHAKNVMVVHPDDKQAASKITPQETP